MLVRKANKEEPDQTVLILVCTVCFKTFCQAPVLLHICEPWHVTSNNVVF